MDKNVILQMQTILQFFEFKSTGNVLQILLILHLLTSSIYKPLISEQQNKNKIVKNIIVFWKKL